MVDSQLAVLSQFLASLMQLSFTSVVLNAFLNLKCWWAHMCNVSQFVVVCMWRRLDLQHSDPDICAGDLRMCRQRNCGWFMPEVSTLPEKVRIVGHTCLSCLICSNKCGDICFGRHSWRAAMHVSLARSPRGQNVSELQLSPSHHHTWIY